MLLYCSIEDLLIRVLQLQPDDIVTDEEIIILVKIEDLDDIEENFGVGEVEKMTHSEVTNVNETRCAVAEDITKNGDTLQVFLKIIFIF